MSSQSCNKQPIHFNFLRIKSITPSANHIKLNHNPMNNLLLLALHSAIGQPLICKDYPHSSVKSDFKVAREIISFNHCLYVWSVSRTYNIINCFNYRFLIVQQSIVHFFNAVDQSMGIQVSDSRKFYWPHVCCSSLLLCDELS